MEQSADTRDVAAEALALAASALKYENLADLTDLLREVGEATGSFAVLLWELAPGVNLKDQSQGGRLFVLADWLKSGNRFASHALPLASMTDISLLNGTTQVCMDVKSDSRVYYGSDFVAAYDITSFVSIPLDLGDSERGALNLYRASGPPISTNDLAIAEAFAKVLPGVYSSLRAKSSLRVMGTLNEIIEKYEGHPERLKLQTAKEALREMATAIARGFRCLETSIYLIQTSVAPNKARLEATTFPGYIRRLEYSIGDSGLTAWILTNRTALHIFDLTFFEHDRPLIEARYPGLGGFTPDGRLESARAALMIAQDIPLPPLSFMGVPILIGDDLLGVIRCCTPQQAPYYYSERDVRLLALAASQVGHFWKNWVQLGAIENENRSWVSLVTSLNDLIRGVASQEELEELAILRQFLRVAHNVIPGADILDVRLHDPKNQSLYFAAMQGETGDEKRLDLTKKRFPVSGSSAEAWVFKHNKMRTMPDVESDPLYVRVFPDVKGMVIAPISSGGEQYGVLDVHITNNIGIPPNTPTIAEVLGQQLGLYLHLSRTLQKVGTVERTLRQNVTRLELAEAERKKIVTIQTRVFEDLEHQLKLPILQAHTRLSALLARKLPAEKVVYNIQAVRGLLRKAERVVHGMGMFVILASGDRLKPQLTRLNKGPLIRLLIEICMDCIFLEGHKSRGLNFIVHEESFDVLDSLDIKCDFDLLGQAIYDIVDNACKYSFEDQKIQVRGGMSEKNRFYIGIINKGLPLMADDIQLATSRGWRGQQALLVTGQGSGIGCWFADQIMRAQGGGLKLLPTNSQKLTEVRLQF